MGTPVHLVSRKVRVVNQNFSLADRFHRNRLTAGIQSRLDKEHNRRPFRRNKKSDNQTLETLRGSRSGFLEHPTALAELYCNRSSQRAPFPSVPRVLHHAHYKNGPIYEDVISVTATRSGLKMSLDKMEVQNALPGILLWCYSDRWCDV